MRVVIVGAGGYGRVALDVLIASGLENQVIGFYDDACATLAQAIRGVPVVGDVAMLKSMLSVESAYVVVAITDATARLKIANSIRSLGGEFFKATHPLSYVSEAATVGDGSVLAAGAVVHPDASIGSHCFIGPGAVVDRDAEVGAGAWLSAGSVVGVGAIVGAKVVIGNNASVERKATVEGETVVAGNTSVRRADAK
ncbi:MAG: DapH/DapD/GlmU-related protein [Rubrobacter sp.]